MQTRTPTQAAQKGGIVVLVLLLSLLVFLGGNQRLAYAEPLGSDIVCFVFNTLNEIGEPIPVLNAEDCPDQTPLPPTPPLPLPQVVLSQCSNGVDDDGDGLMDFLPVLGDPGCDDIFDNDEGGGAPLLPPPSPACSDGRDNDRDGLVDSADPGCSDPTDTDETNTPSGQEAKLVVVKVVINDNGGTKTVSDFSLHVSTSSPGFAEAIGVSSGATTTVAAGAWFVGEDSASGYTATFGGDCNSSGQVSLAGGETKTCIITNNDIAGAAPACVDLIDNDGDNLVDSADPGCSSSVDNDETNVSTGDTGGGSPPSSGGGGTPPGPSSGGGSSPSTGSTHSTSSGQSGSGSSGGGSPGIVLGTATATPVASPSPESIESCERYLTAFIRAGRENDVDQVKRLQRFLRDYEGAKVTETGTYDGATLVAVHALQTKYAADILAPWGIKKSTGFVYLTTRKKVNEIFCRDTQTFLLTPDELTKIASARAAVAQVSGAGVPSPTPAAQPLSGGGSAVVQPKVPKVPSIPTVQPAATSTGMRDLRSSFNDVTNFLRGIFNRTR